MVSYRNTTTRHNPDDRDLNHHRHESLKTRIKYDLITLAYVLVIPLHVDEIHAGLRQKRMRVHGCIYIYIYKRVNTYTQSKFF
jgi:hypothetical protein